MFHYLCFYNPYSTLSSAPFFQDSTLQFNYSLGARGRGVRKRKKNFLATDELLFRPPGPTPNSIHAWQKRHPIPEMAGRSILGLFCWHLFVCLRESYGNFNLEVGGHKRNRVFVIIVPICRIQASPQSEQKQTNL